MVVWHYIGETIGQEAELLKSFFPQLPLPLVQR